MKLYYIVNNKSIYVFTTGCLRIVVKKYYIIQVVKYSVKKTGEYL